MNETNKDLTDKEIRQSLYLSQGLLLSISVGLIIFFGKELPLMHWYRIDGKICLIGICAGIAMVWIQNFAERWMPENWQDDDGINERLFQAFRLPVLIFIMIGVAIIEEVLFRGLMQHFVGYVAASLLFALIHFRYVRKPLLLATVMLFSFCLGWLYIRTGSLAAPVIAHFIINALPALIYKWNGNRGNGQRNPGRE